MVDPSIREKYCLKSDTGTFEIPTQKDIRHITVVTLTSAAYLLDQENMKGTFTHILVDEAAQALECEVLIPLALADKTTCVVLAGDHIQLRPEVHSVAARKRGFHMYVFYNYS